MKTRILFALMLVALAAPAAAAQETFVVGIDRATSASWDSIAASFERETGIGVSAQQYAQGSVAQQVVFQAWTGSGKHHFFMIPDSWGGSLSRYVVDISDVAEQISEAGVSVVSFSGRAVGVPLPFASNWFLAVLEWPEDREAALAFLVAAAGGVGSQAAGPTLPSQASDVAVAAVTKQKMSRADHDPKIDGAIGALLSAAEAALGSAVSQIATALPSSARSALADIAGTFGIPFSSVTSSVTVVLEPSPGTGAVSTVQALSNLGVSRSAIDQGSSLVKITVPITELASLAAQLGTVSFFRAPYIPFPLGTPTEGTALIGADAYHTAGITGTGVKVAVIDLGFIGLSQAQARGDLPATVIQNDLTGTGMMTGFSHGTAVAEVIHDIAPGAELHLIKIADEVDLDQAVTYCLSNGIDVINHSLGWYNTNFYDGTGTIPEIARRATTGGILWVNAAGNEAESHWEGTYIDGNSDGWLDTPISLQASGGEQVILYLTWDEWGGASTDFDLYLYDASGTVVASSTKYQTGYEEPTESIQVSAPQSGTYSIRVSGTGAGRLELFSVYQDLTPAIAASSILAPANATEVVAVGAVDHGSYTTGPQEPYSSQGPTNDGRTKPDLVAPDNVTTGTSPYTTFPGTSGAAPHASGAAALLLSTQPSLTEPSLRGLLLSHTIPMGTANVYGNGRLFLQPPTPANLPPTASFVFSPSPAPAGSSVFFDASASTDSDGAIVIYQWDFNGDGFVDGSGVTATHIFATPATYQVRLTVTDDDGATASQTQAVTVVSTANQPPTASFTASPTPAQPSQWISFDGTASSDPDGYIASYAWIFGDGGTGTGATSFHAYSSPGTYTSQLTVTDDDGASATASQQIVVQVPSAPDLTVTSMTYTPPTPTLGQSLIFTFTVQNVGSASAGSFRVLLQGATSSNVTYASSLASGASRTFSLSLPLSAASETFTVTADDLGQVSESNEGNNTRSVTVTATTPPPIADAGGPYTGTAGQSISFNGSGSTGSITSYVWTFGDGGSASGVSPTHTYASAGTYTAILTVFGPGGQSTDSAPVSVGQPAPALSALVSLPKSTYQVGETLVATLTTNRTAYLYLCEVTPDGRVVLLYPNVFERTNPVAAGTRTVPGGFYTLRVSEPVGTESLYLFAATSPVPEFLTSFYFGFPTLSTNPSAFRDGVIGTMQTLVGSGNWAFDTVSFEVIPETPTTGSLEVVSFPSDATVRLDGSTIGTTPLTKDNVSPGTHTVRVSKSGYQTEDRQVTITAGQTTTLQITLVELPPANQPPIASFTFSPPSPVVGETVQFDGTGSSDPDGTVASYAWSFGDGGTASGAIVTHAFASNTTYTVTLTVTDNEGATGSHAETVTVISSADVGWISPVAHEDPANEWYIEQNAYDESTDRNEVPGAYTEIGANELTSFLFFDAPAGGLQSDRIRFMPSDNIGGNILIWDVDVERDGVWVDVFDGKVEKEYRWTEAAFTQGLVTRMRLRAQNEVPSMWHATIWEVDFHDATVPTP
jgi:PKD repeat protein